ncbi:NADH-quinone oxidoreductase subunit N [Nakamurella sp. UYEF19]|uniref:NADH-quinone oxidoreductase subunit N n=1 Tax=Nakamurella sp. UYEF19 TaxID=1756392 RepID=UPI003399DEAA
MGASLPPVLPEMTLLGGAVGTLLAGSFLARDRQWIVRNLAIGVLAISGGFALAGPGGLIHPGTAVFTGTFTPDAATGAVRLTVIVATLLVIGLGRAELAGTPRESETYTLLLLGGLGADVVAGASDLLVLAVGFLLASIPLYALIGMTRTRVAAEATLKTYLLGALLGIVMLVGVTILTSAAGESRYTDLTARLPTAPAGLVAAGALAVLAGLLFKAGGVPGHFWVPDAAQGAGTPAAAFVTTIPKVGALVAIYRLVEAVPEDAHLRLLVAVLAAASMTVGNLAAFFQTDPRRLLGWSTVSQVGYLLIPIAALHRSALAEPALLLYLAGYAASNITAFAVIAAEPERRTLADYRGLSRQRPWLAGALLVALLSLVGTPPTAVFVGKLTVFTAGWQGGYAWLVLLAVLNSVASLFYYLRWIGPAFTSDRTDPNPGTSKKPPITAPAPIVGAAAVLVLGLAAGLVLRAVTATG